MKSLLVFLVVGFIAGILFTSFTEIKKPTSLPAKLVVKKVIDGDTVLLSDNRLVRLLGVDAPEYGEQGFTEAKAYVEDRVRDRIVRLEPDPCCQLDVHGRTLGYLWISSKGEDRLLNKLLLDQNLVVRDRVDQLGKSYLADD